MAIAMLGCYSMSVAKKIATLRKQKGFTQQSLADAMDMHVTQIKRYEAGSSAPSLEALKKITKILRVSIDSLVFEDDEIGPSDDLKRQFDAVSRLPDRERAIIREVLEGMIIKYETNRWNQDAVE